MRQLLIPSGHKPEITLVFVVLGGLILFMFRSGGEAQLYFYLLFLPLIWIALRGGLGGAAMAAFVVRIGIMLGARVGSLQ